MGLNGPRHAHSEHDEDLLPNASMKVFILALVSLIWFQVITTTGLARRMVLHGTLIILIPSREGLIVASDGRQTLDGIIFCDGASSKLLEPAGRDRFIIAVTGRRGFYPITIARAPDPCEYIRNTPREFDLGEVIKLYVENESADLPSYDLKKVADHALGALTALSQGESS